MRTNGELKIIKIKKRLPNTQKPFLLIYKVIFIKVRDVDYKSTALRTEIKNLDQRRTADYRLPTAKTDYLSILFKLLFLWLYKK